MRTRPYKFWSCLALSAALLSPTVVVGQAVAADSAPAANTASKKKAAPAAKDDAKKGAKKKAVPAAKDDAKTGAKAATEDDAKTDAKADAKAKTADATTGPATPPPAGSSPMAELKKSDAALKKLFQKKAPSWSPEADAKRAEMRKIVDSFLDFDELGRRALARHWEGLAPKQRTEFVSTLRELIERSYLKQVHGAANYNLEFQKETISDGQADVTATLHATSNGKKVEVSMEYKLLYKGGRWLVYDVVTDEQSMLENYRAEFNKIIAKESFDALLKRMKKKLQEKED
jgi:phospholipid transport system substrate-binding protein